MTDKTQEQEMPEECISAENTEEEKVECRDVTHEPATAPTDDGGVDLEELMSEDIDTLAQEFPELSSLNDLSELHSFERYTELRAAGATAVEAYLATAKRTVKQDSRAHLRSTVSAAASIPGGAMSARQLREAREIFTGMSDDEIRSLYKKVTK